MQGIATGRTRPRRPIWASTAHTGEGSARRPATSGRGSPTAFPGNAARPLRGPVLHSLSYWPPAAFLAHECPSGVHPNWTSGRRANCVRIGCESELLDTRPARVSDFSLTPSGWRARWRDSESATFGSAAFDQRTDRQLDGVELDRVFTDKASGKDVVRPQLDALLAFVRDGDTVVVHSMDRLARNLDDLRRWYGLDGQGGSCPIHHGEPDFHRRGHSDGDAVAVGDGSIRRVRTGVLRERQREGIAQARLRGAYRGRKRSLTTQQVAELRRRALAGESRTLLAKDFGISRETVYQYLRSAVGQQSSET